VLEALDDSGPQDGAAAPAQNGLRNLAALCRTSGWTHIPLKFKNTHAIYNNLDPERVLARVFLSGSATSRYSLRLGRTILRLRRPTISHASRCYPEIDMSLAYIPFPSLTLTQLRQDASVS